MIPIDRSEIENWGLRHEAKGYFPYLLLKMIFETTPIGTTINIPFGRGVYSSGFDGMIFCKEASTFVPKDNSVWELKTNGDISEANEDFEKRSAEDSLKEKSETTFIFATTKYWGQKKIKKWEQDKKNLQIWKDVIVYDSSLISNWIEITEVSKRWFLDQKGLPYNGLTSEEYWENWKCGPRFNGELIQFRPKVLISGREFESQEILNFLSRKPNILAVRAATKTEAIVFIIASVIISENDFKDKFNSKCLIIEKLEEFRAIKKSKSKLILIPCFEDRSEIHNAVQRGHHVLIPLGPDDPYSSKDIITLPIIEKDGQIEALISSGISRTEAKRVSREAARDITIIRKLLGFEQNQALWESIKEIGELIPALLVGRWNHESTGDRSIIENLAQAPYEEYISRLQKWLKVESPPLMQIGNLWRLTSSLDLWSILIDNMGTKHLTALKENFLKVYKEIDPSLELEPDQRYMASFYGKNRKYSNWCREGLCQSLILIGYFGEKFKFQNNSFTQNWVDGVIRELLIGANSDLWISIEHELPLLAEASPISFLAGVQDSLSNPELPILNLFQEIKSIVINSSYHSSLLWALEGLAWFEEYFEESTLILVKLSELDPGGTLSNRPFNSLIEIYKPWHYQTYAPLEKRKKVLDKIMSSRLEIGWKLMITLLPTSSSDFATNTASFRWRILSLQRQISYYHEEIFETHSFLIGLVLEYFDNSETKLVDLLEISSSNKIPLDKRKMIRTFIDGKKDSIVFENYISWSAIRGILSSHRSFEKADWSLDESELKFYEDLYENVESSDSIENVRWIFTEEHPEFPDGIKNKYSFEEYEHEIERRRREIALDFLDNEKLEGFEKLINSDLRSWILGRTFSRIINSNQTDIIVTEFHRTQNFFQFLQSFISFKTKDKGLKWFKKVYKRIEHLNYSIDNLVNILTAIPPSLDLWTFIEKLRPEIVNKFWKEVPNNFSNLTKENVLYGIEKLLKVDRKVSAINLSYFVFEKLESRKLLKILLSIEKGLGIEDQKLDGYLVTRLIQKLKDRKDLNELELIKLEWLYMPFYNHFSRSYKPDVIHNAITQDPNIFLQLIAHQYKSSMSTEEKEEFDEQKENRALMARSALGSWKDIPGMDKDLNIDQETLLSWVESTRKLAKDQGYSEIVDVHIGKILAKFPLKTEPWPPIEICSIIDSINTDELANGFRVQVTNDLGMTSRAPFEGGTIERSRVDYFEKQANTHFSDFPLTSKILLKIAKGYTLEAERMDEEAKRDKLDHL